MQNAWLHFERFILMIQSILFSQEEQGHYDYKSQVNNNKRI